MLISIVLFWAAIAVNLLVSLRNWRSGKRHRMGIDIYTKALYGLPRSDSAIYKHRFIPLAQRSTGQMVGVMVTFDAHPNPSVKPELCIFGHLITNVSSASISDPTVLSLHTETIELDYNLNTRTLKSKATNARDAELAIQLILEEIRQEAGGE